jgi:hypothetical protein
MKLPAIITPVLACLLATAHLSQAEIPNQINYQGRVSVQGVNFTGTGEFKFALVGPEENISAQASAQPVIGGMGDGQGPRVLSITVTAPGSGYIDPPVVTINHPTATGATAHAVLNGSGAVQEIIVDTDGVGQGYDSQTTVTLSAPPENLQRPTRWSNDGTSTFGSEPTAPVSLAVSNGLYSVALGNITLPNMNMFPENLFSDHGDLSLRVWFNDGTHGFQLLSPDQTLLSAPYAIVANNVPDGAITSSKIAGGAVGTDQLANGAIDSNKIAPGSVTIDRINVTGSPSVGNLLSYGPGGSLSWSASASSGWGLDGNASTSGKFLGTTDNNNLEFRANNQTAFSVRSSDRNIVFPNIPSDSFSFTATSSGLGIYGTNPAILGGTLGRTFGGLDIDGPVLYGEGSSGGGALGVTYKTGGTAPFFFDATLVEEPVLTWKAGAANSCTVHIGSRTANGDPKLIRFGDGEFVHIGENVADDTLELKARNISLLSTNGFMTINGAGNEQISLGGDGNGDVELGSTNAATTLVALFNRSSQAFMDLRCRDAAVRTLTIYGGADLAEPFAMSHDNVQPGSVVVIDEDNPGKLRMSHAAYDKKVAGIVSGADGINPGISMIQENMLEAGENVALSGRVYVKANNSAGDIQPGDLLTTSAIPGEAMKASDHDRAQGAILGKAMTSLQDRSGKVLVLVTLQ